MDKTEKYIRLIEIASTEYIDKHHHYWSIYWKFSAMLAFVMGLYVFGKENIDSYIQANSTLTSLVFILIIFLIGRVSFLVMCREHKYLLQIRARLQTLYTKIEIEQFPESENVLEKLSCLERRYLCDKFSIGSILSTSTIVISILCIILILLSSFVLGKQT